MVNHKEILRLKSLGLAHQEIAASCGCGRNTVTRTLARARKQNLSWDIAKGMSPQQVTAALFPSEKAAPVYKMPDYEWVHREMQKSGVTLSLLWVEYCEQCRRNGELPYKSTQFNKYYADYVHKTKATMHLEHRPGETMQVDWAGQTAGILDTDTGERLDAYLFVAVLPYSGYAYTEAFLDMKQESWIAAHVNAYRSSLAASPGYSLRIISRLASSKIHEVKQSSIRHIRRWRNITGQQSSQPGPGAPKIRLLWKALWVLSPHGSWRRCAINNSFLWLS